MKIVYLGDSLTFGFKMRRQDVWNEILSQELGAVSLNKGICGDSTGGMLARFQEDVNKERPSHVFLMGGTNDFIWDVPFSVVRNNLASMIYQCQHYRIQPILGIPIPIIPSIAKQYFQFTDDFEKVNERLHLFREWIFHFSNLMQFQVVDFFDEFYDISTRVGKKELYIDGVHPTVEGNRRMAQLCVKTLSR